MGIFPLASKSREPNESGVFTDLLPDGDKGTEKTIGYARKLIEHGLRNPDVREMAVEFCRQYGAAPYDEIAEIKAQFQGVLENFDYRKHLVGGQLLQPVSGILRTRAGDCADLNLVLLPSLLGSIGYPSKAVTVKSDADRPDEFSHVYIETQLSGGQWIPLDVARQDAVFMRAPDYWWQRAEYPLTPGVDMPAFRKRVVPRFGLGQDDTSNSGFDVNQFDAALIGTAPAIISSTAQLVKASNTPGQAYVGTQLAQPYAYSSTASAMSSGMKWLLLGLGVVAVVMITKK